MFDVSSAVQFLSLVSGVTGLGTGLYLYVARSARSRYAAERDYADLREGFNRLELRQASFQDLLESVAREQARQSAVQVDMNRAIWQVQQRMPPCPPASSGQ